MNECNLNERKGKRVLLDTREKTFEAFELEKTKNKIFKKILRRGIESNRREKLKKDKIELSNP